MSLIIGTKFRTATPTLTLAQFLALLDYVTKAHEIEICPSSVRVAIISEPNTRISFKFWLLLPLCHTLGLFLNLKKIIGAGVRIFFVFVNMGPYGSENFKTLYSS